MAFSMLALLLLAQDYSGDWRDDPRMKEVLKSVAGWKDESLKAAAKALGVDPLPSDAVRLEIRDAAPSSAKRFRIFSDGQFQTGGGVDEKVVIILHAEFLINGRRDVRQGISHEAVHAVMRWKLGKAHDAVPIWVREGLAMAIANQGEERLDHFLADAEHALDPESLVRPLKAKHAPQDYVRDVLFIDYLKREKRFDDFVRKIMSEGALEKALGESPDAFEAKAAEFARAEIKGRLGEAHQAYCKLLRLSSAKLWDDLARSAAEFVKAHPDSRYAAKGGYLAAKGLFNAKGQAEGFAAFEAWLKRPSSLRTGFADDAMLRVGRILVREKRFGEAAPIFERLVREYPDNAALDDAVYEWGFALVDAGQRERAVAVLTNAIEGFPKHKHAARAKEIVK